MDSTNKNIYWKTYSKWERVFMEINIFVFISFFLLIGFYSYFTGEPLMLSIISFFLLTILKRANNIFDKKSNNEYLTQSEERFFESNALVNTSILLLVFLLSFFMNTSIYINIMVTLFSLILLILNFKFIHILEKKRRTNREETN